MDAQESQSPQPLSLHVPAPPVRPGDRPDFSHIAVPRAGTVRKPPHDVAAHEVRDLAYSIIRVLDREGQAVGEWAPELDGGALQKGLRDMMRLRAFDQRMMMAQRQGKTSFYMQATGEEAVACAFQTALAKGDMSFPTYRQAGLLIAQDWPLTDLMNEIFSNAADRLRGRQLPVLYSAREGGFFSISGNLGTQYVQAVGWAMASAISGDSKVAAGWIGEGSTAESDFHAALVFASVFRPPVVLNIVNNQWAISSHQFVAGGEGATFAARAHGYAIPALRVDGNDWLAVHAVACWAVARARRNLGPTLIEFVTYRAGPHSSSDDPSRYRPKEESDAWPLGDPIERLKKHLVVRGEWSDQRQVQLQAEIDEEVLAASREAERNGTLLSGPRPPASAMFEEVFAEMPRHLREQRDEAGV